MLEDFKTVKKLDYEQDKLIDSQPQYLKGITPNESKKIKICKISAF